MDTECASVKYANVYGCGYYRVGDDGTVWTLRKRGGNAEHGSEKAYWSIGATWTLVKQYAVDTGHKKVPMTIDGRAIRPYIHSLVLEHFKGSRPSGMVCRHLDGNPSNNHIDNLAWGTPQDNADDAKRHGTVPRGSKRINAKLDEEIVSMARRRVRDGECTADIARELGVKYGRLFDAVYGRSWKYISEPPVACPQEKLTADQVLEIRRLSASGTTGKELAAMFNVGAPCISGIVNRRSWTNVV